MATDNAQLRFSSVAGAREREAERALKIVQINTWDRVGGAAEIALRLHRAMLRLGYEPRLLSGFAAGSENGSIEAVISSWPRWKKWIRLVTSGLESLLSLQYLFIWWSEELAKHRWIRSADIVHLHNLHGGYVSPGILPDLSHGRPLIWTLHDMWALTGHCAYSFDCDRWKSGCGQCPYLREYPGLRRDHTALLWKLKKRTYSRSRLTIVTPSKWLAELVHQSPLLGQFPVYHIPNGIDLNRYNVVVKSQARDLLNLDKDIPLILFIAESLGDRRKGGFLLSEALGHLRGSKGQRFGLVTAGRDADQLRVSSNIRLFNLGYVEDVTLLSAVFSSADVIVCPSLIDNLPNVIVESMACGTPVVAYAVGGIPELVRHMETGYLARPHDVADLARGLQLLLDDEGLRARMSLRCRQVVEKEYSLELQVRRYIELYHNVLEHWQTNLSTDL